MNENFEREKKKTNNYIEKMPLLSKLIIEEKTPTQK